MNDVSGVRQSQAETHEVTNQVPPLRDVNGYTGDIALREFVESGPGAWVAGRAAELGALVGDERMQLLAYQANHYTPELRSHDSSGNRIDLVEYHPSYHELMGEAFSRGVHSLAWNAGREGAFAARATLFYLWCQIEQGTACPMTMTFAGIRLLEDAPDIAAEWHPKLITDAYDPRPIPIAQKRAATVGMALTEKQAGSDLRSITTRAHFAGSGWYSVTGHKWFCSAPMSDGFFTLALLDGAVTCFFVSRSLPDGMRNRFLIQRLKDKLGNRSNASAEIEFRYTLAQLVGEPGRGIATILEMAHFTRFDISVACAGMMRAAVRQAMHHASHRSAFGRRLADQTLMRNVLADLALETEAATLLAFRLGAAFDAAAESEHENHIMRILTPIAKYWLCKRVVALSGEAMECLGGNGYVEESMLARLYREAPVNSIWEGSGNVICLDVLRAIRKTPQSLAALFAELDGADDRRVAAQLTHVRRLFDTSESIESDARRFVEAVALAMQAMLMRRYAPQASADAFIEARVGSASTGVFGTLPAQTDFASVIARIHA